MAVSRRASCKLFFFFFLLCCDHGTCAITHIKGSRKPPFARHSFFSSFCIVLLFFLSHPPPGGGRNTDRSERSASPGAQTLAKILPHEVCAHTSAACSPVLNTSSRAIFYAEPLDDTPPKSVPDKESIEARCALWSRVSDMLLDDLLPPACAGSSCVSAIADLTRWVCLAELKQGVKDGTYRLRGDEPMVWFQYVDDGGPIFPMSVLTVEGAPIPK